MYVVSAAMAIKGKSFHHEWATRTVIRRTAPGRASWTGDKNSVTALYPGHHGRATRTVLWRTAQGSMP